MSKSARTESRIPLYLPRDLYEALREKAHQDRISMAEAVRRALTAWLNGEKRDSG